MSDILDYSLKEQFRDLEAEVPHYDYEGLSLPHGIEVDAYFGAHSDVAKLDGIGRTLSSYDLVVHENAGSNDGKNKILQKIANGDYKAREKMIARVSLSRGQQVSAEDDMVLGLKALYNIRRPLVTIDPPDNHPIIKALSSRFASNHTYSEDFDTAVEEKKEELNEHAQVNLDRENYMLRSFCEQVNGMIRDNPRLARKKEAGEPIRIVLFNFGITHAGLFAGIQEVTKRSGNKFEGNEQVVMKEGLVLPFANQAFNRIIFGREIDDEIAAKALLESVVSAQRLRMDPEASKIKIISNVVGEIHDKSMPELQQLFNQAVEASV